MTRCFMRNLLRQVPLFVRHSGARARGMTEGRHSKRGVLREVPLFDSLSGTCLDAIGKIADEVNAKAGQVLVSQDHMGWEFVIILEGQAIAVRDGRVVNHHDSGEFFGELALLSRQRRAASVIAVTDMRLLVVHRRYFRELLRICPDLHERVILPLQRHIPEAQTADRSQVESAPVAKIPWGSAQAGKDVSREVPTPRRGRGPSPPRDRVTPHS